jgi:hypothetical protein
VIAPSRLLGKTHTPQLGPDEQFPKLLRGGVHGERRNERRTVAMPAPPRHELGHVVASDLGQQPVLAKERDQLIEFSPRIASTAASKMLADL